MRHLILLAFFLLTTSMAAAQLPDWLQSEVDSTNIALEKFGRHPFTNDWDSIDTWNSHARSALMDFLHTPGISDYPFEDALQAHHVVSEDHRLVLISLFNNDGGSFYSHTNFLFLRMDDGSQWVQCLGEDGMSPMEIDTLHIESRIVYVWTESTKTCNTCYGWAIKSFEPLYEPDDPQVLLQLDARISENDAQAYDPVTKIVTYSITLNEMISLMSEDDLQSLWTDPSRLEVVNTSGWPEYVEHGQFSVRRALMGAPWKE